MGHLTKRALGWTAPLALVAAAGLAACGDGDTTTAETAGVATGTMGSDVHLENLAADIGSRPATAGGSDVHLENLAADIGSRATTAGGSDVHLENLAADIGSRATTAGGSDVHLENLAADIGSRASTETSGTSAVSSERAEAIEHDAHLAGNAATYGADDSEPSNDEFVPGTRHMPLR
jgi:hypothetical protein